MFQRGDFIFRWLRWKGVCLPQHYGIVVKSEQKRTLMGAMSKGHSRKWITFWAPNSRLILLKKSDLGQEYANTLEEELAKCDIME